MGIIVGWVEIEVGPLGGYGYRRLGIEFRREAIDLSD